MSDSSLQLEVAGLDIGIGDKQVCRQLDIRLCNGQIWALLGENGVGKSTLLATLAGARQPQQGGVMLQGRPLNSYSPRERAHRLGWLTQRDDDPFPATVMEKVLVGRHPFLNRLTWEGPQDEAIAREALAAVDLAGFELRDVATLSGGERRRVSIATLLAQQTPLLLLDEPLTQLDLRHQSSVLRLLAGLSRQGRSIMMITHDPNHAVRFASHALLLFGNGRTLAGPVANVLTAANIADLYRCPMREVNLGSERLFFPAPEKLAVVAESLWRVG